MHTEKVDLGTVRCCSNTDASDCLAMDYQPAACTLFYTAAGATAGNRFNDTTYTATGCSCPAGYSLQNAAVTTRNSGAAFTLHLSALSL